MGDSNMSEYTNFLKVGTTVAVLTMIENGDVTLGVDLEDPVKAIRDISKDTTLKKKVKLEDGRELTALEIQKIYLEQAQKFYESYPEAGDSVTQDILQRWGDVLKALEDDPRQLSRELDWVIKKELMLSYIDRKGSGWDDPRVSMMDLQYHDIRRDRGLYYLLDKKGMIERISKESDVQKAMKDPPQTTRAKIRGDFIRFAREKNRSYSVDWTFLKLNGYWEETILCMNPFLSSDKRVDELISTMNGSGR